MMPDSCLMLDSTSARQLLWALLFMISHHRQMHAKALLVISEPSAPRGFDFYDSILHQAHRTLSEVNVVFEQLPRVSEILDFQEGPSAGELLLDPHERIDP